MDRELVRDEFVSLEFRALAKLCQDWSEPRLAQRKGVQWREKLVEFRQAVSSGIGSGGQEDFPHELVHAEYLVVQEAVRWALRSCHDLSAIAESFHC